MFSFNKLNLAKQINFVSKCFQMIPKVAGERNNFGPSFYGMEKFNRHSEFIGRKQAANIESIRSSVQRCVEKPENKAFTEDIKSFLYLTKSDTDFNLLVQAVSKYHSQEASPIFNFRFGAPLMRLAHKLNKTNEMLDLYLKEEPNFLHTTVTPGFILMNKLFDEKRYDDVLKVFNRLRASVKSQPSKDKDYFPFDALKLAAEANLEKNDEESVKNASEFLSLIKESKPITNPNKLLTCLFLTALQRENIQLANDVFTYFESKQQSSLVVNNLRIITLCLSNKVGEALNACSKNTGDKRTQTFYFKSTLDILKNAVEQSKNDEHRKALDEVMSRIKSENLVARSDIKEYATRQVNFTMADKERMRNERRANQANPDTNLQETFKSRNRSTNNDFTPDRQQANMERRQQRPRQQQQQQQQQQQSGEEQVERQQPASNQRSDANRTQTNSPKNRRQYLE